MTDNKMADLFLEMAGDPELKSRFVANPKGVFAERGIHVPEGVELEVLEDTEVRRHIVIPHLPSASGHAAEEMEQRVSKSFGPDPVML